MKKPSLYIHIPFCTSKCDYCDFFSVGSCKKIDCEYIFSLVNECNFWAKKLSLDSWDTIYFGGGTPSLLSENQISFLLKEILKTSKTAFPKEITFEANPETLSEQKLRALNDLGCSRISLGVQSFNQKSLSLVNRNCTKKNIFFALDLLKKFWHKKISLDLIAGFPNETRADFLHSLKTALDFGCDHISLYTLTLEEGTPLFKNVRNKKIEFFEDFADELWIFGRDFLLQNGFFEYEVSNFCKNGAISLHNLNYWQQNDYVGIGSGAVGTIFSKKIRIQNTKNIKNYTNFWKTEKNFAEFLESENFFSEKIKNLPLYCENLTNENLEFEFLMTGFRTAFGISNFDYKAKFGKNLFSRLSKSAIWEKFLREKKAQQIAQKFFLTNDGRLFLNELLRDLILEK